MKIKNKVCEHKKIVGVESYAVSGELVDGVIHLKQGDGGLDLLECEDCHKKFSVDGGDCEIEFN